MIAVHTEHNNNNKKNEQQQSMNLKCVFDVVGGCDDDDDDVASLNETNEKHNVIYFESKWQKYILNLGMNGANFPLGHFTITLEIWFLK